MELQRPSLPARSGPGPEPAGDAGHGRRRRPSPWQSPAGPVL